MRGLKRCEQRVARNEDGKTYYTDAKDYKEWEEEFVKDDVDDTEQGGKTYNIGKLMSSNAEKGVDNSAESGIINYAKELDIFIYNEDDIPLNAKIKPQDILDDLVTSPIGKETLKYIEDNQIYLQLDYEPQYHSDRGYQSGREIRLFMDNIKNIRTAAQTLIHEVTHYRYNIGHCRWAEAVCMAKEKMHITGRNKLTVDELRYIVYLANSAYPELNWKKGGYINGKKI